MDQRQLQLLARSLRSHEALVARTRQSVDSFITARWNAMESWRGAEMARFKNDVIPAVLAAERQIAQLTNVNLTQMDNYATGQNARTVPLDVTAVTGAAIRNGVEPSVVYGRPEVTVNTALANGSSLTVAVTDGLRRVRSLAMSDLQLTRTHTVARQGRGRLFRRTLSGTENCALCVIASTQRYRRGTLMPIHPGCDCGIQEEQTTDTSQVADPDLLAATHGAIERFVGESDSQARVIDGHGKTITLRGGSTRAADYTDLIVVRTHGEYGPTLAWRSDTFTGEADLGN